MMEIPPKDFSNAPTRLVVRARGTVSEENRGFDDRSGMEKAECSAHFERC